MHDESVPVSPETIANGRWLEEVRVALEQTVEDLQDPNRTGARGVKCQILFKKEKHGVEIKAEVTPVRGKRRPFNTLGRIWEGKLCELPVQGPHPTQQPLEFPQEVSE